MNRLPCREEAIRKYVSIAWTLTTSFFTCALSKVILEENTVDPSLEDNVETPYNWIEYIYRAGSSLDLHSVIQSGWITGGKDKKDGRQTVIATWDVQHSIVDWDSFSKTQTLLGTLKIQNPLQEEHYVYLEVERLFPQAGCARNERQCLTVPQNRKLFLWMLVCEWMEFLLSIHGIW